MATDLRDWVQDELTAAEDALQAAESRVADLRGALRTMDEYAEALQPDAPAEPMGLLGLDINLSGARNHLDRCALLAQAVGRPITILEVCDYLTDRGYSHARNLRSHLHNMMKDSGDFVHVAPNTFEYRPESDDLMTEARSADGRRPL